MIIIATSNISVPLTKQKRYKHSLPREMCLFKLGRIVAVSFFHYFFSLYVCVCVYVFFFNLQYRLCHSVISHHLVDSKRARKTCFCLVVFLSAAFLFPLG